MNPINLLLKKGYIDSDNLAEDQFDPNEIKFSINQPDPARLAGSEVH